MNKKYVSLWLAAVCLMLGACAPAGETADSSDLETRVDAFLADYNTRYLGLVTVAGEAQWLANTVIVDGVDAMDRMVNVADGALSRHTGSVAVIDQARAFLKQADQLPPLKVRELKAVLYAAADKPQTVAELTDRRIAAESAQTSKLFGFTYTLDGKEVTPNEIDGILAQETDPAKRLAAWNASKEVGKVLKSGLAELVGLRNDTVRALDYSDYFSYQVSDYGMTREEMMALNRRFLQELRPLYRELHTWARYTLAEKYGTDVPDLLPAHWLPNRWGQDWSDLVTVEGADLDGILADKPPEWLVKQAENFYVSLGFPNLPDSFYARSSLYPVAKDAPYKKNTHASAWHMDLDQDVRSLMSVEPNARWYETTHHELGHIYYYLAYSRPEVPPLLRAGANRAFHEAVGSLMGLASMQQPFLQGRGLVPAGTQGDSVQALLKDALNMVVFLPFSAGTMTHFEHDLYAENLPVDQYNARWWQYVQTFQGIAPPEMRDEQYCDAATKTHINDDAAQYYDYAISFVVLHQLHAHIASQILKQDPRATDYYGNKEVGAFLQKILASGATRDWREVMRENLGSEISAQPMLDYFAPLTAWLKAQNEGRTHTLPDL